MQSQSVPAFQGVGAIVKERISCAARGEAEGERPMLLFPEGTTTNGLYLLPFKSGAFLAGCALQPVILQYQQVIHPPRFTIEVMLTADFAPIKHLLEQCFL